MMDNKVAVVPDYIAEWIEYCKRNSFTLFGCFDPVDMFESLVGEDFEGDARKCIRWCRKESSTFALAWINGYKVEKEKKYLVKIKGNIQENILVYGYGVKRYFFSSYMYGNRQTYHTKDELTKGGFEWVFSCEGVEVEEVEE